MFLETHSDHVCEKSERLLHISGAGPSEGITPHTPPGFPHWRGRWVRNWGGCQAGDWGLYSLTTPNTQGEHAVDEPPPVSKDQTETPKKTSAGCSNCQRLQAELRTTKADASDWGRTKRWAETSALSKKPVSIYLKTWFTFSVWIFFSPLLSPPHPRQWSTSGGNHFPHLRHPSMVSLKIIITKR